LGCWRLQVYPDDSGTLRDNPETVYVPLVLTVSS